MFTVTVTKSKPVVTMSPEETEHIALFGFSYAALLVTFCCLVLHLKNHFGCGMTRTKRRHSLNSDHTLNVSNRQRSRSRDDASSTSCCCYCCCLYPLNGHIEFYPVSTLCYFIFLLCTITLIILFDYKYYQISPSINQYCPLLTNTILFIHNPLEFTRMSIISADITEYIWSYIVLLLVLWETLFNFYRFYDAKYMVTYFRNASKIRIFALFSIYTFIFSILYLVQIHLYWAIFPIIILLHFIFNIYCIVGFVSILKYQYMHLWEGEIEAIKNHKIMKDLLHIIHRVRICSVITTLISSLCLFLVEGCYTSYIYILLPGFWMISSIVWTLNFAKNESWFQKRYKKASGSLKRMFSKSANGKDNINKDKNNKEVLKLKSPSSKPSLSPIKELDTDNNDASVCVDTNTIDTNTTLHNVHSSSGDIQKMITGLLIIY